ncbi:MAG TPA: cupin domain-containing protein [Bacteriovoracaceae bacterium]|nr:cupin domain-containing protein [Bacteriovoracaceae bacterium]
MKTGLAALISPHTLNTFLELYSTNTPLLVKHPAASLRALRELPFLASLPDLLSSWPHTIQAHLPDLRDEASSVDTTARDARKLFENGMGLLFNEVHTVSPVLCEWLEEIKQDLGVSALTYSRCMVYATPDGRGTAPHFDQNINFVLQLQGTKTWKVAPNSQVLNPMSRHTMGQPADPELSGYLEAPLPSELPETASSYELTPGSLLFVPRGCWHQTLASGEALSLNFTFSAPTWIDLFTAAIRSRLALSPQWRQTADGVSSPERRPAAQTQFDSLLQELVADLPFWKAADILDATDPQ